MKYAIVFGSNSYEHEISIVSAVTVGKLLDDVCYIYVSFENEFYLIDKSDMNAAFFSSQKYKKCTKLVLKKGGFFEQKLFSNKKIEFDCAINIIHGKDGEDGKIAALFDFYGVKYIGPRIAASTMSFDKYLSKIYAKSVGVKVLDYEVLSAAKTKFAMPVILKPARLGSSIGINIVKDEKDLDYAYASASEFDDVVLAEPFYENIQEINLAGYFDGEKIVFSKLEEPKKDGHLDFSQKYLNFKQEKVDEVELDASVKAKIYDAFSKIYLPFFKGALIRCDFFVYENEVYLNEINPNPGSYANYLFDDFKSALNSLATNLPEEVKIRENFNFLNKIVQAK